MARKTWRRLALIAAIAGALLFSGWAVLIGAPASSAGVGNHKSCYAYDYSYNYGHGKACERGRR